jgi:hypothetical protein
MDSHTLFWNNETWETRTELLRAGTYKYIDYVAADKKRPFCDIVEDDEIYVLTIMGGNLYLGGRLIAAGAPVSKIEAERRLGRDSIDKKLYVLAKAAWLDSFRPHLLVPLDIATRLELVTTNGAHKRPETNRKGLIAEQAFRPPFRLDLWSAAQLRGLLV